MLRPVSAVFLGLFAAASLSGCAGLAIGAGAEVGTAAASERGLEGAVDDAKIRVQINDLWFRKDAEMYRKIGLTILEGRVLLTGVVPNEEARANAVQLTWQVAGVKEVYNEIEVVPDGETFADSSRDTWIEEKMKAKLLLDKKVQNINYAIDVTNSVIYVLGLAQDQDEMERVLAYARDIPHVTNVVNHILLKTDPRRVNR